MSPCSIRASIARAARTRWVYSAGLFAAIQPNAKMKKVSRPTMPTGAGIPVTCAP